ncbi:hypothetical protein CDS [Bradyrhizobium sp.]|nr:hypothetical protein CDS [Bradyrhizobium sp.]
MFDGRGGGGVELSGRSPDGAQRNPGQYLRRRQSPRITLRSIRATKKPSTVVASAAKQSRIFPQ